MKTADKMLEELGFHKNMSECYGEAKNKLLYEHSVMQGTDIFELWFDEGDVLYCNTAGISVWMSYELVAAVAAKCKEMGWVA